MHAGGALVARGEHDCVDAGDVGEVGELTESEYEEGGEMKLGSSVSCCPETLLLLAVSQYISQSCKQHLLLLSSATHFGTLAPEHRSPKRRALLTTQGLQGGSWRESHMRGTYGRNGTRNRNSIEGARTTLNNENLNLSNDDKNSMILVRAS